MLFRHEINPYNVTDTVAFRDLDKTLTLTVRADAGALVVGMKNVYEKISTLTDDSSDEEKAETAKAFAEVIFGAEQAARLCDFYKNPLTVIKACGEYFKRLGKKITKVQKKITKAQKR